MLQEINGEHRIEYRIDWPVLRALAFAAQAILMDEL